MGVWNRFWIPIVVSLAIAGTVTNPSESTDGTYDLVQRPVPDLVGPPTVECSGAALPLAATNDAEERFTIS